MTLIEEAKAVLEKMNWSYGPPPPMEGCSSYFGQFDGWQALVITYPKGEERGVCYPAGYAGTLTCAQRSFLMKMPPDTAKEACRLACLALTRE